MRDRLERALSIALVVSALVLAAAAAHREFIPASVHTAATPPDRPTFIDDWRRALEIGIEIGSPTAPVKVVEFADLECPFCRGFNSVMRETLKERPTEVSFVFVHYPLENHRFAQQAARASECAAAQGRFQEFVNAVYDKQDSLGMKSWGSYALDAGIRDTLTFRRCALDPATVARIEGGKSFGDRIHVSGTPTLVINGWRYDRGLGKDELRRVIGRILKGASPADSTNAGIER
jgi:protein-disulfide isomerase